MLPVPSRLVDPHTSDEPAGLGADDPLAGLAAWVADARVDDAAAHRSRHRWLVRQAAEDTGLRAILTELAAAGAWAQLRTRSGRGFTGRLVAVGRDHVVVAGDGTGEVVVPLGALAVVRRLAAPIDPAPGPDDGPPVESLAGRLVELSAERPLVVVGVGDEEIRGELRSAGPDVVTIVTAEVGAAGTVHVAQAAIDHLVVLAR